ncbi:MAG TPA: hypothetical protein PLG05_09090 [Bacteroidales bacterium]|mgnify:FL=1|nr:hypothetical protein [Bacteroidales bacterium]HOR60837.1 hypothetical protein [Bacteroidales bacterium]HPL05317.1 hypothetical protein [Bacteroidales bacterium]
MKKILIIILIVSVANACKDVAKTDSEQTVAVEDNTEIQIGGTYEFGDFKNKKDVFGQLLIYPDSDTSMVFHLSKNTGEPDFQIYEVMGRTLVADNKASFQTNSICENAMYSLYFEFDENSVKIIQDDEGNSDCSFSYEFRADGDFEKTNSDIPTTYTHRGTTTKEFKEWVSLNVGIDFSSLEKRGDVYYYNNQPYTGTAINEPKVEHYWQSIREVFQMKDGKPHGKYIETSWESGSSGNYVNGLKEGKWEVYESATLIIQNYKNGLKDGEWKYYFETEENEPYRIEVYKEGVKISEQDFDVDY